MQTERLEFKTNHFLLTLTNDITDWWKRYYVRVYSVAGLLVYNRTYQLRAKAIERFDKLKEEIEQYEKILERHLNNG